MSSKLQTIGYMTFGTLTPLLLVEAFQQAIISRFLPLHFLMLALVGSLAILIANQTNESLALKFLSSVCFLIIMLAFASIGHLSHDGIMILLTLVFASMVLTILFLD